MIHEVFYVRPRDPQQTPRYVQHMLTQAPVYTFFFLQRVTNLLMMNAAATFRKEVQRVCVTAGITVKLGIKLGCGYYFVTTMILFVRLRVPVATRWRVGVDF